MLMLLITWKRITPRRVRVAIVVVVDVVVSTIYMARAHSAQHHFASGQLRFRRATAVDDGESIVTCKHKPVVSR